MDYALCNISALRYHRIPPPVLSILPSISISPSDINKAELLSNPTITDVIGLPVNLLVADRKLCTGASGIKHRCWSAEIPKSGITDSELGIEVSSPLFTLLQLSTTLSLESLILVIYELCGRFTVFNPTPKIEEAIKPLEQQLPRGIDGWKRVCGTDGKSSDLWIRDELVGLDELATFIQETKGLYGNLKLQKAARFITGVTMSPFEAQLSLLLSLPRSMGGEGLPHISNNEEVALSANAKRLCSNKKAYIDLYVVSNDGERGLAIECQGRISHGPSGVTENDAERATALQSMGYDVLLVTYSQISDRRQFDVLRRLIFKKLGMEYTEKDERERLAELDLRRKIFINWEQLGEPELIRKRKKRQNKVSVPYSQNSK